MSRVLALRAANEIADQFTKGFCNDRMVDDFTDIIYKHIGETKQVPIEVKIIVSFLEKESKLTPRQGLEEYKKGYAQAERDLKREPLSDEEIMQGFRAENDATTNIENYYAGVELAEKHWSKNK